MSLMRVSEPQSVDIQALMEDLLAGGALTVPKPLWLSGQKLNDSISWRAWVGKKKSRFLQCPMGERRGKQTEREGEGGRVEGEHKRLLLVMCMPLKSPQGCGAPAFSSVSIKAAHFMKSYIQHLRMTTSFLQFFQNKWCIVIHCPSVQALISQRHNFTPHMKRTLTKGKLYSAWIHHSTEESSNRVVLRFKTWLILKYWFKKKKLPRKIQTPGQNTVTSSLSFSVITSSSLIKGIDVYWAKKHFLSFHSASELVSSPPDLSVQVQCPLHLISQPPLSMSMFS